MKNSCVLLLIAAHKNVRQFNFKVLSQNITERGLCGRSGGEIFEGMAGADLGGGGGGGGADASPPLRDLTPCQPIGSPL